MYNVRRSIYNWVFRYDLEKTKFMCVHSFHILHAKWLWVNLHMCKQFTKRLSNKHRMVWPQTNARTSKGEAEATLNITRQSQVNRLNEQFVMCVYVLLKLLTTFKMLWVVTLNLPSTTFDSNNNKEKTNFWLKHIIRWCAHKNGCCRTEIRRIINRTLSPQNDWDCVAFRVCGFRVVLWVCVGVLIFWLNSPMV